MTRLPWKQQRTPRRLLGWSLLAVASIVTVLLVISLIAGWLTSAADILINLIIIIGTLLVGIIFLRGDEIGAASDEGQRDAQTRAQSLAFFVAYFGLFALFLGAGFFPPVLAALRAALGLLLLVILVVWLGGYMWYRWWA